MVEPLCVVFVFAFAFSSAIFSHSHTLRTALPTIAEYLEPTDLLLRHVPFPRLYPRTHTHTHTVPQTPPPPHPLSAAILPPGV